jgi:hypothetical protein
VVVVTALGPDDVAARGGLPQAVRTYTKPLAFAVLEQLLRQRLATSGKSAAAGS